MAAPAQRPGGRADRISLRASAAQRRAIERAAEATGKTLTAFILDAAALEAQRALADRRLFTVGTSNWERFLQALDEPAREKPRLRRLLETPGVLG